MPEVGRTDGGSLRFYIYGNEHGAPHVHVRYGGSWVKVAIADTSNIIGKLTGRQRRLVRLWIDEYRDDLFDAWNRAQRGEHPGKIV